MPAATPDNRHLHHPHYLGMQIDMRAQQRLHEFHPVNSLETPRGPSRASVTHRSSESYPGRIEGLYRQHK